jgi:outer membrane autotransporter protein
MSKWTSRIALGAATVAVSAIATPAMAQSAGNPAFQDFFTASVCGLDSTGEGSPPSEALLARCADTFDPETQTVANISSDSESSLNPNQVAIAASSALARARSLAAEAEERMRDLRDEEEDEQTGGDDGYVASFGPWSVFANIEAEWFNQDRLAYANERGFDGDRVRGTIGADYRVNAKTHIGLMLHYEDYKSDFDDELPGNNFAPSGSAGSIKSETISATLFANASLSENAWLDAAVGLGWSDNVFRRNALFQPSTRAFTLPVQTRGDADGKQFFASMGMGYDFYDGALAIGPYVRARYVRSTIDAYAEQDLSGSALQLAVDKQKATSLTSVLGVQASYAISTGSGVVLPQVRFEFEHEYEDDARTTLTSFVNDPRGTVFFPVTSDAPDRNYFNVGTGLVFVLPNGVMPFVDYEVLLGYRNFDRHRVTAGLRLEF